MTRAFGKVILFGEHAVVYGKPAIAVAMDRGATAQANHAEASQLFIEPWNLMVTPSQNANDELADVSLAFAELLTACSPSKPVFARVSAEIPAGAGLGCSAAIAVAIVKAIDELEGRASDATHVVERSLAWERVFHGSPSGIDSTLAARGGLLRFARGQEPNAIVPRSPLHFIVACTDERANTKAMVQGVARQQERSPGRVEQAWNAIEALVNNAQVAIEQGDVAALGTLMNLNHNLLAGLMLSTTKLETLCALAREHGAHGAKLTGSGGGGAMIALVPADRSAQIREALAPHAEMTFHLTVNT